jgi:hypothetical protein
LLGKTALDQFPFYVRVRSHSISYLISNTVCCIKERMTEPQ